MSKPELLVVAPQDTGRARNLAARRMELGIFFPFTGAYQLPTKPPSDLRGFKLIVAPDDRRLPSKPLRSFERSGGRVIRLETADWTNGSFIERIPLLGGLTLRHRSMLAQMEAVPDDQVFRACLHWSTIYNDFRWSVGAGAK